MGRGATRPSLERNEKDYTGVIGALTAEDYGVERAPLQLHALFNAGRGRWRRHAHSVHGGHGCSDVRESNPVPSSDEQTFRQTTKKPNVARAQLGLLGHSRQPWPRARGSM